MVATAFLGLFLMQLDDKNSHLYAVGAIAICFGLAVATWMGERLELSEPDR
jgi:hypothetical protein